MMMMKKMKLKTEEVMKRTVRRRYDGFICILNSSIVFHFPFKN